MQSTNGKLNLPHDHKARALKDRIKLINKSKIMKTFRLCVNQCFGEGLQGVVQGIYDFILTNLQKRFQQSVSLIAKNVDNLTSTVQCYSTTLLCYLFLLLVIGLGQRQSTCKYLQPGQSNAIVCFISRPIAVDEVDTVLKLGKVWLENMRIADGYQNL